MRRMACVLLACVGFLAGHLAYGQCRNGQCVRVDAVPSFAIDPHATDPKWAGLYYGNEQVAALDLESGDVWRINRCTGEFGDDCECGCRGIGQAGDDVIPAPGPQGLDRRGILKSGERWTLNGEPSSRNAVRKAIGGAVAIPDDSAACSLTLIGSDAECQGVVNAIAGSPLASELAAHWLVQSFRPDNALVAKSGFVLDGKPSIYGQLPDGQVLFRAGGVVQVDDLIDGLRRGIEGAEGKRAPNPSYDPQADAGLTVKPQVDATVQAPPWFYALTHMGALMLGGMAALGGRWAIAAMLIGPAMQALEDRLMARIAPPPAVSPVANPPSQPAK